MSDRPNILVFLTDDHGAWASGAAGRKELWTPSLDHLAATGVLGTNVFTPCPVCSPARASFLTGQLPSQHGIHDFIAEHHPASEHINLGDRATLAHGLGDAGYRTALFGKWHCGQSAQPQAGFDHWFGFYGGQYPHCGEIHFSDQGTERIEQGQRSALLTDRVVEYLRQDNGEQPLFTVVGYVDTHTPYKDHPERLVNRYRQCSFAGMPEETRPEAYGYAKLPWDFEPAVRREHLAQYFAAVTMIDEQVGRVLDALESTGQRDNTLVIYTSDHGYMKGHHGVHGKGNATGPQNFFDEAIRVPFFASWPNRLPMGQRFEGMVTHCDTHRTVLDAAGVAVPTRGNPTVDPVGRSFLGDLQAPGSESEPEAVVAEYGNARMIRTRRYKLVVRYPGADGPFEDEFYDLTADPREAVNRISDSACGEVVDELRQRLNSRFADYDHLPTSGKRVLEMTPFNPSEPWRYPRRS